MTLGELEAYDKVLEKIVQLRWWGTLTSSSPLQLVELGIEQITDQGSSWIKIMSKNN